MRRYGSKSADSGSTAASTASTASSRARISSASSTIDVVYAIDGLAAAEGCSAIESAAIALAEVLLRHKGTRSLSRQGIGQAFVRIIGVALGLRTPQSTGSMLPSSTAAGADGSFRLHWSHGATLTNRETHQPAQLTAATVFALLLSLYLLSSSSCGTLVDVMAPDCVLLCVEGLRRCSAAQGSVLRSEDDDSPFASILASHPLHRFSSNQASAARYAAAAVIGDGAPAALRSPQRSQAGAAAAEGPLRKGVRSYGSIAAAPTHSQSSGGSSKSPAIAAPATAPAVKRRRTADIAEEGSTGDSWAFDDDDDSGSAAVQAAAPAAGRPDGYASSASSLRSSASLASSAARSAGAAAVRSDANAEELPSQLAHVLASVLGRGWCPWLSYAADAGAGAGAGAAGTSAVTALVPPRGRYAALLSAASGVSREPRDLYRVLLGRLSLFLLHRMVAADLDDAVDVGSDAGAGATEGSVSTASAAGAGAGAGAGAASVEDSPAAAGADTDVSAVAVAARISGTRRALLQASLPLSLAAAGLQAGAGAGSAAGTPQPTRALSMLAQGLAREWHAFRTSAATTGAASVADEAAPIAVACWLAICEEVSLIAAAASTAASAGSHTAGAVASSSHAIDASGSAAAASSDGSLLEVFLHGEAVAAASAAASTAAHACTGDGEGAGVGDAIMSMLAWAEQPRQLARLHQEPLCKIVQGCLTVLVNCTNNATAGVQALMRWRGDSTDSTAGSSTAEAVAAAEKLPMALAVVARILHSSLAASLPVELRKGEAGAEAAFNTAVLCLGLLTNCAEHSAAVRAGCITMSSASHGSASTSASSSSSAAQAQAHAGVNGGFDGYLLDAVCRAFAQHHAVVAASLDTDTAVSSEAGKHHSDNCSIGASGDHDGYETEAVEDSGHAAGNSHGCSSAVAPTGHGHASDSVVLAAYSALFLAVLLGEGDTACSPAEAAALLQRVSDALSRTNRTAARASAAASAAACASFSAAGTRGAAAIEALQLSLRVFARLQGDAGLLTPDVAAHLAAAEAAVLRLRHL